jgi:predicted nucleotide-binding protein (sugar kinase/HSP70/actin superfamily)
MHGRKSEMLFYYFVADTTRDYIDYKIYNQPSYLPKIGRKNKKKIKTNVTLSLKRHPY